MPIHPTLDTIGTPASSFAAERSRVLGTQLQAWLSKRSSKEPAARCRAGQCGGAGGGADQTSTPADIAPLPSVRRRYSGGPARPSARSREDPTADQESSSASQQVEQDSAWKAGLAWPPTIAAAPSLGLNDIEYFIRKMNDHPRISASWTR